MVSSKLKTVAKVAVLSAVLAAANAHATQSGAYLGGQLGWGQVNASDSELSVDNDGLAGRVFGGYQFNQYVAAELGYNKFSDVTGTFGSAYTARIKTYAVDLVGKGILPLQNGFSLYGKLGVAYLNEEFTVDHYTGSYTQDGFVPTVGLGVMYDVSPNLVADLGWSRIQGSSSNDDLDNTNFVGLGLTYYFG